MAASRDMNMKKSGAVAIVLWLVAGASLFSLAAAMIFVLLMRSRG